MCTLHIEILSAQFWDREYDFNSKFEKPNTPAKIETFYDSRSILDFHGQAEAPWKSMLN